MDVFPETDGSITPIYALINSAQKSIDMSMWALADTTFSGDLVAACNRGVTVRVVLDQTEDIFSRWGREVAKFLEATLLLGLA